jgi:glycosyltransferase involved in cell wall biosynthesis
MASGRRRLCWITPDYFLFVDAPIIPRLIEHYDIDWIIINAHADSSHRLTDGLLDGTAGVPKSVDLWYRQRDPRLVGQYIALCSEIRAAKYDLVYTSFHGLPYFLPILAARVDANKIIYAVHNASTPKGASNEWAMTLYHRYVFRTLRRFHVFSEYQLKAIASLAPGAKHYCVPFPLVDYGPSTTCPPEEPIRFLFFGHIKRYKRLDILIKAFKRLRAAGTVPIELYIAGGCDDWGTYQDMIGSDPSIVARVELIPATDIPNLVGSCHYVVLPYQDIAQSAVLTLAFQYGKPVVVSDIEGFRQSVVEGTTGFFFESESVDHLSAVMGDVIAKHRSRYAGMKDSIRQVVAREYSLDAIVTKYRAFIDDTVEPQRA